MSIAQDIRRAAPCEHCTDPDGESCFPMYGMGPNRHEVAPDAPNTWLGSTRPLPAVEWPSNYREDPDEPGMGVWWCEHCGYGKPDDAAAELGQSGDGRGEA